MVESPYAVMAVLTGIAALFFWLEKATGWKLFRYLIPLIWIYATPMVLTNVGFLPSSSPAYDVLRHYGLPIVIVWLLLSVDVGAAVRIMGRGIAVMLLGTAGIVLGAPVGYFAVHWWLEENAWTGFGALAGSWIGGTGNLAAAAAALGTPPDQFGLAVLADSAVYVVWLPLLLASKSFADRFNRWTRVSEDRLVRMEEAAAAEIEEEVSPDTRQVLYLLAIGFGATWFAQWLAPQLPEISLGGEVVISTSTWVVLLVTTIGIALSFTKAKELPGSHDLAMGVLYVFVARMGAVASLEGLTQAPAFLAGAFIWIGVHGLFCLAGAWLFRVDVHSAAIASAANVGGAASAPVVAAHHRESLVPASILMALLGYAMGNYLAILTGHLCRLVGGG
ncbi:MAG: DUF819 family protein [Thermoanaerobaculia bacterium]|nr:DUF819 family protein [Thermoanaerobaculia bacterium]